MKRDQVNVVENRPKTFPKILYKKPATCNIQPFLLFRKPTLASVAPAKVMQIGNAFGVDTTLLYQKRPFSSISFTKRSHLLGKFCLPLIKGEVSVAGLMRIC